MLGCNFPTIPQGSSPYDLLLGNGEKMTFTSKKKFRDFSRKLSKYFEAETQKMIEAQTRVYSLRSLCYTGLSSYEVGVVNRGFSDSDKMLHRVFSSASHSFYWPFKHSLTVYGELISVLDVFQEVSNKKGYSVLKQKCKALKQDLRQSRKAIETVIFYEVEDYSFALKVVSNG